MQASHALSRSDPKQSIRGAKLKWKTKAKVKVLSLMAEKCVGNPWCFRASLLSLNVINSQTKRHITHNCAEVCEIISFQIIVIHCFSLLYAFLLLNISSQRVFQKKWRKSEKKRFDKNKKKWRGRMGGMDGCKGRNEWKLNQTCLVMRLNTAIYAPVSLEN